MPRTPQSMSEAEQVRVRDMLVRDAIFAADSYLIDNATAVREITPAERTRLTLQVAIGYLISQGLITATPDDQRPEWLSLDLPEHMQPDLAATQAAETALASASGETEECPRCGRTVVRNWVQAWRWFHLDTGAQICPTTEEAQ
jgi:hypothetical protein